MEVEQLSFFSLPAQPAVAVCCMDGRSFPAEPAEGWMQRLVSGVEYFILVGGHQMALRPTQKPSEGIPTGHEYYLTTMWAKAFTQAFLLGGTAHDHDVQNHLCRPRLV